MPHGQYNADPPTLKDPDPPKEPEFVLGVTRCHYYHHPSEPAGDLAVAAVTIGEVTHYVCLGHLLRTYPASLVLTATQLPAPRP